MLKEALAKKYVPDTGLRVYPVGWEEEMEADPLPAGKGKRTMGAKLMVALGCQGEHPSTQRPRLPTGVHCSEAPLHPGGRE